MRRALAAWLVTIGSALALCGVVINASLNPLVQGPLDELRAFFGGFSLLAGLPTAFVGSVMWAARQAYKTLKTFGLVVLSCSLLGLLTTPLNIHDWTVTIGFIYATAFAIGVIFLGFAFVKRFSSMRVAGRTAAPSGESHEEDVGT